MHEQIARIKGNVKDLKKYLFWYSRTGSTIKFVLILPYWVYVQIGIPRISRVYDSMRPRETGFYNAGYLVMTNERKTVVTITILTSI